MHPFVYSLHSFKHTFVSQLANASVPMEVTRQLAQHTTDKTTKHVYSHIHTDSMIDAINTLPDDLHLDVVPTSHVILPKDLVDELIKHGVDIKAVLLDHLTKLQTK